MLTDEQIIKALECCAKEEDGNCAIRGCPLHKHCKKDIHTLEKSALDLINRQKAEIEKLNVELVGMRGACESYKMHHDNAQAEIERLNKEVDRLSQCVMYHDGQIVDAIKEFWEELKKKTKWDVDMPDYILVADGDNLVKEMEGGTDE